METISFITGILGLIIGILALFKLTIDVRRRTRWRAINRAIEKLEPRCRTKNFDVVIGLADGLVPAAILALNWRIPNIYFIDAPVANRASARRPEPLNLDGIPDLTGKRVLLIDNHIYTGTNMRAAVVALQARHPAEVVTAALFRHTGATSVFVPDESIYEVNGAVRNIPWSVTSDHRHHYLS